MYKDCTKRFLKQLSTLAIVSISIGTKKQKGTTPHGPFPFQHYVREKN